VALCRGQSLHSLSDAHLGPIGGLLGAKLIAILLGGFCVWRQRYRVIQLINYFFAALVTWNMAILLLRLG
jgi:hypothetical protein